MASGTFAQNLVALVKDGVVKEAQVDEAVRRILAVKVRLGLFEQPYADEARAAAVLADPKSRAEARRLAQRSMVLLRNDKQLLPLKASLAKRRRDRPARRLEGRHRGLVDGVRPRAGGGHRARGPARPARRREGRATRPVPRSAARCRRSSTTSSPARSRRSRRPEQAEAAFQQAVETAQGRRARDRGDGRARRHERRGGLARLARAARPPAGAAAGACSRSASPSCWC